MMWTLCAVKDLAVGAFMLPQPYRSIGEAERSMIMSCGDEKHHFRMYAKDFVMFMIGRFDDATGRIEPLDTPQPLLTALDARDRFDREYGQGVQPGQFSGQSGGPRSQELNHNGQARPG